MSLEMEIKFTLPDRFAAERVMNDELICKYMKDGFTLRETYSEYYDTSDWALAGKDYFLRVRSKKEGEYVAALKQGKIDAQTNPGFYAGQQWLCVFDNADTLTRRLAERNAPVDFIDTIGDKTLEVCFKARYTRRFTTLYLPEMVRIELSLDSGELITEDKSEPLFELGLELLYGSTANLLTYSEQLKEHFGFEPSLLTKQQRALRLLRSR